MFVPAEVSELLVDALESHRVLCIKRRATGGYLM